MQRLLGFTAKLVLCVAFLFTIVSFASDWQLIGPEGGNVRSLAYDPSDPNRIILGTSAGQLFISQDGGNSWALFAHLGPSDDYVFDHVVFDPTHPATVYAAAWDLFDDNAGGVFRSDDGGRTWKELMGAHGKSIRALAMAPSDHNTLVIGALDGVFRSRDGGATWERISPENPMRYRKPFCPEELCFRSHRSAEPGRHLRRHAAPAMEDHQRWGDLAQPEGWNPRRF